MITDVWIFLTRCLQHLFGNINCLNLGNFVYEQGLEFLPRADAHD